jgi:hypothetical protein
MTNENVINRLQTRLTFWGKKPPPPPQELAEESEQKDSSPEVENNAGLNGEDAKPE